MSRRVKMSRDARNKGKPWVVRWSDGIDMETGKPRWFQRSFRQRIEARRFAAEKRIEAPDITDAVVPEVGMTLGRFLREWSQTRNTTEYSPGTRSLDQNTCDRLIDHFGKRTPLADIRPMEATQFIAGLERIDGRGKPLAGWTRARILRNARTMFNDAVAWGLLDRNPFGSIQRPKVPESRWHYLMPEHFHDLLNARTEPKGKIKARSVPLRYKVLYALAYCCGLRLGEILSLTWADNIEISRHVHEGATTPRTYAGEVHIVNRPATAALPPFSVKDKESRRIHIPRRCLELLMDLKGYNDMTDQTPYVVLDQKQVQTVLAKWARYRQEGRPWQNKDMANNTLTTFKRHVRWAGIEPQGSFSIHVLRKCCITNWANSISNPEVVRKLAGHSDIKTTMQYYSTVTEQQRKKAAEAIDRLLEAGLATNASGTYGT